MSATSVFNNTSHGARRAGIIGGLTQRFQRYRTYRQILDELESYNQRELDDLNIARGNIRAIAYRAAYDG